MGVNKGQTSPRGFPLRNSEKQEMTLGTAGHEIPHKYFMRCNFMLLLFFQPLQQNTQSSHFSETHEEERVGERTDLPGVWWS